MPAVAPSFMPSQSHSPSSTPMSLPQSTDTGGPPLLLSDPSLSGFIRTGYIAFLCNW